MQFSWAVVREESEKQYAGSNSRTQYWEWTTAGHRAVFPSEMWIFTLHGSLAFPLRDPRPLSCLFMREHFLTFLWCVQATTCLRMLSTIYSLWFDTTVVEYLNKTLFFFQRWFWLLWRVYACGVFECWRLMLCVLSAWECDCSALVFSSSIRGSCHSWNSDLKPLPYFCNTS